MKENTDTDTPHLKDTGKQYVKQIVFFFILVTVFLSLISFFKPREKYPVLPLNQVMEKARKEEIKSISVEKNTLTIVTNDGSIYTSEKEEGETLLEIFAYYHIDSTIYSRIAIIHINKEETSFSFWIDKIISWTIFASIIIFLILPFLLLRRLKNKMPDLKNLLPGHKKDIKSFTPIPGKEEANIGFNDIGDLEEVKEELMEVVDFLKHPAEFKELGITTPRGILLTGKSGGGKTMLAKAVAKEAGVNFFVISGSEFVEIYVGAGAAHVREVFKKAKENTPCIIFVDELDAIGRHRSHSKSGIVNEEREQTLNQLLVEMDGFEERGDIIIIAATNRPDVLDPALIRPGRFDRIIEVPLPNIEGREKILKIHCANKPLDQKVDLRRIAKMLGNFSGADIKKVANEAALFARRRKKSVIEEIDFRDAIIKVVAGLARKDILVNDDEKKRKAIHETGHAFIARKRKYQNSVQKISIIEHPGMGGFTWVDDFEEKKYLTPADVHNELMIRLGGKAAESVFLENFSNGAQDDLYKATQLAHTAITQWGMSKKIGPVFLGKDPRSEEFVTTKPYSEITAQIIDEEVKDWIITAENLAKKLIEDERERFLRIANALFEKEELEEEEFERLYQIK